MIRRTPLVALACGLLLATTACSSEEKVGSDDLTSFAQQTEQPRLGESKAPTASAKPVVTKAAAAPAPVKTQAAAPVATRKPAPKASTPAPILKIDINGDNTTSTQFNPANAVAYKGTVVTWTNKDSVPRGVKAGDGTFASGAIAPGKSFSWTATKTGTIEYSDSTRPYAVASLTVQARG